MPKKSTSSRQRRSPRSDKDLLRLETMVDDEAASHPDPMDAFWLQTGGAVQESPTGIDDMMTIEFGHHDDDDEDLLALDPHGHRKDPMLFPVKRNLDPDFCDSSTDSYWEDNDDVTKQTSKQGIVPKWDVTLANSVQVLKSQLRESSSESRWTGKTVPESPHFHKIHHRPLPKSTQQQEEEEMNEIKAQPFKARNLPRFQKPNVESKSTTSATTTIPQPFHFHSTTIRQRPVPDVPQSKEDRCDYQFKARPMPKSMVVPPKKSIMTPKARRIPSQRTDESSSAPRTNNNNVHSSSHVEKVCVEWEVKTMRVEFHMKKEEGKKRQTTVVQEQARELVTHSPSKQSFQLNCMKRHEAYKQKQAEKRREEEKKNRQNACFKARPLPASMKRPKLALPATSCPPKNHHRTPNPSSRMNATNAASSSTPRPKVVSPLPSSSKKVMAVKETMDTSDDLTMFLDTEQFSTDSLLKANRRALCVMVRLVQVTSTVMIFHFIFLYWNTSGRVEHAKRAFQEFNGLTASHLWNRDFLDSWSPSFSSVQMYKSRVERHEIPSMADAETLPNKITAPEVINRWQEREPVMHESSHFDGPDWPESIAIDDEPVEARAENQESTASSQFFDTVDESASRSEMPGKSMETITLNTDWNDAVSSKYVMNFPANNRNHASYLSIDTVRNTGMSEEIPIWGVSHLVSFQSELHAVPEEYEDSLALTYPEHFSGNDSATPPRRTPMKAKEKGNKTAIRIATAATRFAPDFDYFEGLTPEDPETIQKARDDAERKASNNNNTMDETAKTLVDDKEAVRVTKFDPDSETGLQDYPETVLEPEPTKSGAMYFDFLEGFVTEDRYLQRMNGRASRKGRTDEKKSTQEIKKPSRAFVGSDYHVQRWLDLSVDEMVVLNGIFGVRLDSSFKRDVYRIPSNHA